MIEWGWLIAAFVLGDLFGIIAMAICVGGTEKKEEHITGDWHNQNRLPGNGGQKENRQRGNADGSKGGVL